MWDTLDTSIPRPTTSVATRILTVPSRKARMTRSRTFWARSPWMHATSSGRRDRRRASLSCTLSVPRFVRQNTIACRGCSRSRSFSRRSNFRVGSTVKYRCSIVSTASSLVEKSMISGSRM